MQYPSRAVWSLITVGFWIAIYILGVNGGHEAAAQEDITVNCDAQETLTAALAQAAPGTTILISGTCMERVTVTTDRITLDGQGGATLDGGGAPPGPSSEGVITIEGAKGVVLNGLTVQNGPDGIIGRRGAAFTVSNTIVQDNGDEGIQIDENTTAELADCTVLRNVDNGILVFRTSSATFRGTTMSNDNGDEGIVASLASSIWLLSGANITVNNNADTGLSVSNASALLASGTADLPVTITANGNMDDGLVATVTAAMTLFGTTVEANNNASDGISIRLDSSAAMQAGTTITTNQNGDDGIDVSSGAHFNAFDRVMITSNANMDEGFAIFGNSNLTMSDERRNSSLVLEGNTGNGLRVTNSSHAFVGTPITLTVQGSATTGIVVADASHIDLLSTTTVSNNAGNGIIVVDLSSADLLGNIQLLGNAEAGLFTNENSNIDGQNLTIMDNGSVGLFGDFSSLNIHRSTITQNTGTDIVLVLGTRADLTELTFGSLTCDASVFLTGDTGLTCPTASATASVHVQ